MIERLFKCIKCTCSDVGVTYRPEREVHGYKSSNIVDEDLRCACKRCGYDWSEDVEDKGE